MSSPLKTFNIKTFAVQMSYVLIIVLLVEAFRFKILSDHNGEKFLVINMNTLGEIMDDHGDAIVLQPHTIETDYGNFRLKLFCSIRWSQGKFHTTKSKRFNHNINFFGQPLNNIDTIGVWKSERMTSTSFGLEDSNIVRREKFEYYGQVLIPSTITFNFSRKKWIENKPKTYDKNGYEIRTPDYEKFYYEGVRFFTTSTRSDTPPIELKDGTILYSEYQYTIYAPYNGDWEIVLDGEDYTKEKYIILPTGEKIECSGIIIEPYWGNIKQITTLDNEVILFKNSQAVISENP